MKIQSLSANNSFCIIPWVHMYYFTDGYVYPCPAVAGDKNMRYGSVTDSPELLWNSKKAKEIRKDMINGIPISECIRECNGCLNSCKTYFGNDLLENNKKIIEDTHSDGTSQFNFVAWNVIESNLCNLKCKYCSSNYSNLWDDDKKIKTVLNESDFDDLYFSKLDTVQEIWFASGEPVLQNSTYKILNKLIDLKKLDVRIRFITNLMKTEYKGRNVYDILNKFNDVIVFGSWDMNGKMGEYIRVNSKEETIKNTIRYIKQKNIRFYLQSVMSIFNIAQYPQFHYHLYEEGLLDRDQIRYYNLHYPEKYRYSILPHKTKNEIERNLIEYKKWISEKSTPLDQYPNRECPLSVIDKIIDTMYTGKWGHWDFSKERNEANYYTFLKENMSVFAIQEK